MSANGDGTSKVNADWLPYFLGKLHLQATVMDAFLAAPHLFPHRANISYPAPHPRYPLLQCWCQSKAPKFLWGIAQRIAKKNTNRMYCQIALMIGPPPNKATLRILFNTKTLTSFKHIYAKLLLVLDHRLADAVSFVLGDLGLLQQVSSTASRLRINEFHESLSLSM